MTRHFSALAVAATLTLAVFGPAGAAELPQANTTMQAFKAPGVITLGYRDPAFPTNAAGVLRQGGLAVAGTVRWLPAAPAVTEARIEPVKLGAL